jgi:hypothetical protein
VIAVAERQYRYGADISGYVRPDGFEPEVAVLCPDCCYRRAWAEEAQDGEPLDEESYDALIDMGVFCEACRRFASEWCIQEGSE